MPNVSDNPAGAPVALSVQTESSGPGPAQPKGRQLLCRDVMVLSVAPYGPEGQANGLWALEIENPGFTRARPGQFAMLRPPSWGFDPLWARPLSLSRILPDRILFHFLVAGRGTAALTKLAQGERITIWGPLGNGFAVEPETPTLLVAGGVGLAPFVEYAAVRPDPANLSLLFGHRPPLSCYPFADLAKIMSAESFQDKNMADIERFISILDERIASHSKKTKALILACGPTPLLKTVRNLALKHGVRCQLSLENRMACGVGACLGCVATDMQGHRVRICAKGPVFWATKIEL